MVDFAYRWGLAAAGKLAVLVAQDDGGAQVRGHGAGGPAEVEGLAEGSERDPDQPGAQVGGQAAGPGQQVDAPLQQTGLEALTGAGPDAARQGQVGQWVAGL